MSDCIFCKIIKREIPSKIVYEDDVVFAFNDIEPCAPIHVLIVPKEHITSADYINESNSAVIAHIFEVVAKLAKELKLENGYRVVNNCGEDGQQSVKHLHFHLIGGRSMQWPPG